MTVRGCLGTHCDLNYIKAGGDVFRLQRILGHATLEMARKYVNMETSDLQKVHQQFSLLATASR
jgi:site-specific recombinase XerD